MQLSLLDNVGPLPSSPLMEESEFIARLSGLIPEKTRISLTRNRSSIIHARRDKNGVCVARVQHAFRAADERTMKALARFIVRPDKRSRRVIDEFIRDKADLIDAMAREARPASPMAGSHRDLAKILAKVQRDHGVRVKGLGISWSRAGVRKKRRSIKFGSFSHAARTIYIHPELDDPSVPDYFVEYIVYHELLHSLFPPSVGSGNRRDVHNEEFKRFERKFRLYKEAVEYEKLFVKTRLG